MTRIIRRTFRGNDYEFGVTGDVIHARNIDSGSEVVYHAVGEHWKRKVWRNGSGTEDFVLAQDLRELLTSVLEEARNTTGVSNVATVRTKSPRTNSRPSKRCAQ